ncbi:hypothetical protein IB695_05113 [Escherichia coli]|nr:hypothetical protein [Escherichia coli]
MIFSELPEKNRELICSQVGEMCSFWRRQRTGQFRCRIDSGSSGGDGITKNLITVLTHLTKFLQRATFFYAAQNFQHFQREDIRNASFAQIRENIFIQRFQYASGVTFRP